jgi:hypothetical protein
MSSLPAHAWRAISGCEAAGTRLVSDSNILKEIGLDGMVKTFKLPLTYRHAAKM